MGLAVLRPGLFSTLQDRGRTGYRAFGVPLGGVFDLASAMLANALLGNPPDSALIEITLLGGHFEARAPLALALAGAPIEATLIDRAGHESTVRLPTAFPVETGECLKLGRTQPGARTYLAVLGGWLTPSILGSRSSEIRLETGDIVPCRPGWTPVRHVDRSDDPFRTLDETPVRVVDGPDSRRLDPAALDPGVAYTVSPRSDRMGLRLTGPTWTVEPGPERVSAAVSPGAVQVAGGQPLVLGVACGTMGGYPHVAHVISADLDRLAQARPGDRLRFGRVSLEEARQLDREFRHALTVRTRRIATASADRLSRDGPSTPC